MDLCVHARHTDFCVYVEGRNKKWRNKEGWQERKEIILVKYLLQIPFLCICSPEFPNSPLALYCFFSLGFLVCVWIFRVSMYCILVSLFLLFCLGGTSYAIFFLCFLSIFYYLVFDSPASIIVANRGLISSLHCCFSWLTSSPMYLFTTLSLSFNLLQDFVILCLGYYK